MTEKGSLKLDPELKSLMDKLEFIKTARTFRRWRTSFLNKFESFLEQKDIDTAQKAYDDFKKTMDEFVKLVRKVEDFVEKGELTVERYTVKARHCFAEMSKMMTNTIDELEALIPQTGPLEKKRGYNKFHIGAVLIRDDFEEYGRLTVCADILTHMRKVSLGDVADKQILEEMENFNVKLQKFCDVMADLGLYEVMLKCREFANADNNLDDLIFLDLKTGGIGELNRQDCIDKRVITLQSHKDENGNDIFSESVVDEEGQERLLKILRESPKLGLGFGNGQNDYEEEEVNIELEKIQNMWGVKLRKTPKNIKGEEFVFVDQRTGAFGELSRKACLDKGLISEIKDDKGKSILGEAEDNFDERATMVESLRALLNLGVSKE